MEELKKQLRNGKIGALLWMAVSTILCGLCLVWGREDYYKADWFWVAIWAILFVLNIRTLWNSFQTWKEFDKIDDLRKNSGMAAANQAGKESTNPAVKRFFDREDVE